MGRVFGHDFAMVVRGHASIPRFITKGTSIAVVAVTMAGALGAATAPENALSFQAIVLVFGLGIVHAMLGTVSLYLIERRGTWVHLYVHFALALAVAIAALVVSRGFASLMIMSLISQAVLYLPAAAIAGVVGTSAVATFWIYGLDAPSAGRLARRVVGWAASATFVIGFSQVLVRQRRTQAEVERLATELGEANGRLRTYARDAFELATTKERNRIAREIHDGLGHYLTVVHVQLEAALAMLRPDPNKAQQAVEKAQELTHAGLDEVRRSVAVLRGSSPEATSTSLVRALEKLASESTTAGLVVSVAIDGTPRPMADPIAWTLYRAAQEAITNVQRHARASTARIELSFRSPEWARLRVEDDGVGAIATHGGFGLIGLRERAELVGGKMSIGAGGGRGFALEMELPA